MKLSIIYLSSGESVRFKSNKLLYKIGNKELYKYGLINFLDAIKNFYLDKKNILHLVKFLVISTYEEILEYSREVSRKFSCKSKIHIECIKNKNPHEGISNSIKLGINAFEADKYIFAVADQPCMSSATIYRFLIQLVKTKKGIFSCKAGDDFANPIAFSKKYRDKLIKLSGNIGGKIIVQKHLFDICYFPIDLEEAFDVDLKEDIKKVKRYLGIL